MNNTDEKKTLNILITGSNGQLGSEIKEISKVANSGCEANFLQKD